MRLKNAFYITIILGILLVSGCMENTEKSPEANNAGDNAPMKTVTTTLATNQGDSLKAESEEIYDPVINPADFTPEITNKYLTFSPGKKMIYEGRTDEGIESIEVYVNPDTKKVMGVETTEVWDRVWLDGELIEETLDWYAQDKEGNVWYFGEDSKELEDGEVVSTKGSWEAGVDGAKPGIVMEANPKVGDSYRQEYYAREAEDMAEVISLGETVQVNAGDYTDCIRIYEWSPLEPDLKEHKYHCPEVGGVTLEAGVETGEMTGLVKVEYDAQPTIKKQDSVKESDEDDDDAEDNEGSVETDSQADKSETRITEDKARDIALSVVDGTVKKIELQKEHKKLVYNVELKSPDGNREVVIDAVTGEVIEEGSEED